MTGGGKKAAEDLGVPYLGAIPLDPEMVKAGDEGRPFLHHASGSPTVRAVKLVMENLVEQIESETGITAGYSGHLVTAGIRKTMRKYSGMPELLEQYHGGAGCW